MIHKITFPQGTSLEDMADQIDEMVKKGQAAKAVRDAADKSAGAGANQPPPAVSPVPPPSSK